MQKAYTYCLKEKKDVLLCSFEAGDKAGKTQLYLARIEKKKLKKPLKLEEQAHIKKMQEMILNEKRECLVWCLGYFKMVEALTPTIPIKVTLLIHP